MENLLQILSTHTKNNVSNENLLINTAGIATVLKMLEISLNDDLRRKVNDFARPYEHLWSAKGSEDINSNVRCLNANGVFYSTPLHEEFMTECQKAFDALTMKIDVSNKQGTCDEINAWVNEKTDGNIESILQPNDINEDLALLLVNSMFFKGSWKVPFDPRDSFTSTFTLGSGSNISIPFMCLEDQICYLRQQNFVSVKLEYSDTRYCCILTMSETEDIKECASKLTMSHVSKLIKAPARHQINVQVPKFDVSNEMDLSNILKNLGMAEIFEYNAIVKGKIADCELFVSKAKQVNRIKVDEKGTTAASVTLCAVNSRCMPTTITFSKPFIMIVMDTLHMVPVMGCVIENPQII